MRLFKKGKVKEVYEIDENTLLYRFTDNVSVFDKVIPTSIPRKGETLCRTSTHWMKVAGDMGIHTDYRSMPSPNEMIVERVNIIHDYSKIDTTTKNYLIPLEVIARHYLAGSLLDRIKKGKVNAADLGLDSVEYGTPIPGSFLEFTTKLEKFDRPISEAEAIDMAGLTRSELDEIKETVMRLDERMSRDVKPRGLLHVDGKKEFAFDGERRLMLIDTFGTADEDRWWDAEAYERGEHVELSKEHVRKYYRDTGYHTKLMEARDRGEGEPDIPPLPDSVVGEVSELYMQMYERLTGSRL